MPGIPFGTEIYHIKVRKRKGEQNMAKYTNKLIRLNKKYPIWDNERDEIDGYTDENDMAIITYESSRADYFEAVIVSGKYMGVYDLGLSDTDLAQATFIFNKINGIGSQKMKLQSKNLKIEYAG